MAERFSIAALTGNTSESSPRLIIWSRLLQQLNGPRLIMGYGAGSSAPLTRSLYSENGAAHNFFIAHIVELGLIGFAIFMRLLINMAIRLKQSKNIDCLAVLTGIMVIGIFLDLLTTKFFWAGMMLASIYVSAGDVYLSNKRENEVYSND